MKLRLSLLCQADVTVVDQWKITIVPKLGLSEDHKLNKIGSHPQKVTKETEVNKIKEKLLEAEFCNEDDPYVGDRVF